MYMFPHFPLIICAIFSDFIIFMCNSSSIDPSIHPDVCVALFRHFRLRISIRGRCLFTLRTTTDFKMLKEQELQVFIFPVGGAGYIGPGVKGQKPQAVELCT